MKYLVCVGVIMNIYKALNEITKFIDENIEEQIDYEILAKIMGVNTYTMQKIFSLLTNISLSEYIRKRKLSNAGYDLYNFNAKVMDIAIKYGYDNATSFSRAFETFHGIKPSKVNSSSKLKNFPRIIFDENIKIINTMEYKVIELEEMTLYGLGIKTNNIAIKKDAPKFFEKINKKYQPICGDIKYGMITYDYEEREECNEYYVLYDVKVDEFEKIVIPASKWLVFRINSSESKDIQDTSDKFYLEFLPSCKYSLRKLPELEYYHDGVTDFLVPIY